MKYNLSNNWHHCEPEIDVNSALICCLIPQHFTRGNSTYDFHLKLWSNEHDLSWIIPWFLPSNINFVFSGLKHIHCDQAGASSCFLILQPIVHHETTRSCSLCHWLFVTLTMLWNRWWSSHWSCHSHCALVEASLCFLISQPIVYCETTSSLFTAPLTVSYSCNRLWSSRWTCQANRNSKSLEASYLNFV